MSLLESVARDGDAELVRHREIDALALRTVAERGVVDFDFRFHVTRRAGMGYLRQTGRTCKPHSATNDDHSESATGRSDENAHYKSREALP